ncbi:MAG: DUF465 domain-containing protein [Salaquimonas sp.]
MAGLDETELRVRLAKLEIDHADLSLAIDALTATGAGALTIQRFKKKKLTLKDEITRMHSLTTPNIIA